MRIARHLVFCMLTISSTFPALSQTPSTTAAFSTAGCGKPVCKWNAFGPQTFTRETGKPTDLKASFGIRNPNTKYTMVLQNNGVASAVIALNKAQIFGPSDFNPNVGTLQKSVSVQQGANTLSVELGSKPGTSPDDQHNRC